MARTSVNRRKPVRKEALSRQAYDYIANQLLSHRLVPGDLLNRRDIAAELKMSVAPVLEAMVTLEADGFLKSIPRKGTLVRAIRPEDIRGSLVLREAYECQAARLYCGEPIRREWERLRALAIAVEESEDGKIRWQKEFEFHHALISLTDCPALLEAFEKVMRRKLFMALNLYLSDHPEQLHDNHLRLLDVLRTDNPDEAERAVRHHFSTKAHISAKSSGKK